MFELAFTLASSSVSLLLSALGIWGLIAFFPRKMDRGDDAAHWLLLAIWLGFAGITMNAFYWRILHEIFVHFDILAYDTSRLIGRIGDFVWKGLGILSIYLHFYARYRSIPEEEQTQWSPLLMGFYPDKTSWLYRLAKNPPLRKKGQ